MTTLNLLRDSVTAMRNLKIPDRDQDAVFALSSIGVERALKLCLGAHHLEADGVWPTKATMKDYGHNLVRLETEVLLIAEKKEYEHPIATERMAFFESSATLRALLEALSYYGREGRFHNLDILAGDLAPLSRKSPADHWTSIEASAVEEFKELDLDRLFEKDYDKGVEVLATAIAGLLDKWWYAIHVLLLQGAFGEYGKTIGWLIMEVGHRDPFRV